MDKISRRKHRGFYAQSMTNAPELLARLREVGRCMESELPSAARQVREACRTLANTAETESAEIAAAGRDLAKAAVMENLKDSVESGSWAQNEAALRILYLIIDIYKAELQKEAI